MLEEVVLPIVVSGLVLGSLYVMMAVGLSLVWSTLGIFNFAHGALMMIGAYAAWTIGGGSSSLIGIFGALAVAAVLGFVFEYLLARPFQNSRAMVLTVVMTTLAAMIVLENLALIVWGGRIKQMAPLVPGQLELLSVAVSAHEALIMASAPVVLVVLALLLKYTGPGRAIRAVGQNREAATLVGIHANRFYAITFAISAVLAAVSGILLGSIRFITPEMGAEPLLKAMIVVIFGGLGSLVGTIASAYAIGMLESFLIYYLGLYWTPTVLFALMIVVLFIKPTGLFREK